jgi:formylglycine-generating enzyme required for sulfatase activity/uncharacterized caspase-like protein
MRSKRPRLCLLLIALALTPALLLSSLPGATAQQGETRGLDLNAQPLATGRYYALVIGNNNYQYVRHLQTAETDAKEVEALLRDSYGFQTKLLLNATRAQIIGALTAYRRELTPDANLLIYYAGHGYNDRDADKAYWLPVDASKDDPANWISADDITTTIKVIPARHVLIVADSCYSGTLTRSGIGADIPASTQRQQYLQKMLAGKSRSLMASGGDEPVADGGSGIHSIFADALLRGLRQIDKAQFTARELFNEYIEESVAGRASQTPEYDPLRNSGHEAGDFVFIKVKRDSKTIAVAVGASPVKVDPAQQELAFWTAIQNSTDPEDFKDYLARYPNGLYAGLARRRVAALTSAPPAGNTARPTPTPTGGGVAANTTSTARPGGRPQQMQSRAGIEFVWIPAGSFMMGGNKYADEKPAHRVTISEGFYMGKYEVTQARWQAVMGSNPANFKDDNLPVDSVSWDEAVSFIAKLNAQNDGYTYRLPSEAEWEYAARAGTTTAFAFGDSLSSAQANFDGNYPYGGAAKGVYREKTMPVGSFQPNAFGLFDMHGNVWEWCQDWYHGSYAGAPTDGSAWLNGGEQEYRVVRGGSWVNNAYNCRSAYRLRNAPDNCLNLFGFRVVAVARP